MSSKKKKTEIINGRKYKLNNDGTPSINVSLIGESDLVDSIMDQIGNQKYIYTFMKNDIRNDTDICIWVNINNISNQKNILKNIFIANSMDIKMYMVGDNFLNIENLIDNLCEKTLKNSIEEVTRKIKSIVSKSAYSVRLDSESWKKIREKAIVNADHKCQLCNSDLNLVVHHRTYSRMGTPNENKDLVVLCQKCHKQYHGKN